MHPTSNASFQPQVSQVLAIQKFEETDIQVIKLHEDASNLWFTGEEIGLALGLTDPRTAVLKIFHRHRDELEEFSGDTKLVSPGGIQETRIYSEEGLYLITMFARSPKAKAFRKWVINLVKAYRQGEIGICKSAKENRLTIREERLIMKEQRLFLATAEKTADNIRRGKLSLDTLASVPLLQETVNKILRDSPEPSLPEVLNLRETCKYLGISRTTYHRYIKLGLLTPDKHKHNGYHFLKKTDLDTFLKEHPNLKKVN